MLIRKKTKAAAIISVFAYILRCSVLQIWDATSVRWSTICFFKLQGSGEGDSDFPRSLELEYHVGLRHNLYHGLAILRRRFELPAFLHHGASRIVKTRFAA